MSEIVLRWSIADQWINRGDPVIGHVYEHSRQTVLLTYEESLKVELSLYAHREFWQDLQHSWLLFQEVICCNFSSSNWAPFR